MIKFSQCPICLANFNNNLNEPRILFKCGHSLCLKCLNEKINFNEKNFTCPIDKIKYENINSVESFPKNIALIDLLQTKNIEYLTSPQPKLNTDKFKLLESIKKFSEKKIKLTQYCKIHPNKNLEIICLDDKCKICTNCALFGEHKNHNIINIDDFEKEIEVKSEVLIDLFDTIEKKFKDEKFSNSDNLKYDNLLKYINEKFDNISNSIVSFTKKVITKIQDDEKKMMEKIKQEFHFLTEKILFYKTLPNSLKITIDDWKSLVQKKLDILNDITDKDLDCSKLIENEKLNGFNNLIEKGNSIINEFEIITIFPFEEIENKINNFSINFDENVILSKSLIVNNQELNFNEIFNKIKLPQPKKIYTKNNISDFSNEIITNISKESKDSELSRINNIIDFGINNNNLIIANEYDNFLNISDDLIFPNQEIPKLTLKSNKSSTNLNGNKKKIKNKTSNSKSKSKTSRSPTPNKDKINYIKQQFKKDKVNLSRYKIGDDGAILVSKLLEKNKNKICELKLTKCEISDLGIQYILKKIIECINLNSFNISNNYISDKSCDYIVESLIKNKSLKIVYLSNNNFSLQIKEKIRTYNKNGKLKIFI